MTEKSNPKGKKEKGEEDSNESQGRRERSSHLDSPEFSSPGSAFDSIMLSSLLSSVT